jgi:predicted transcriptional regulator
MIPLLPAFKLWSLGTKLAILAAIVSSIFGTGIWTGYKFANSRYESLKAEIAQERVAQQQALLRKIEQETARSAELDRALQKALAQLKKRVQTITKEVIREVEKPVYRCELPDNGRMLLNDAIRAANSATGADSALPPNPPD